MSRSQAPFIFISAEVVLIFAREINPFDVAEQQCSFGEATSTDSQCKSQDWNGPPGHVMLLLPHCRTNPHCHSMRYTRVSIRYLVSTKHDYHQVVDLSFVVSHELHGATRRDAGARRGVAEHDALI